jgi:hypothetical protein
MTSADKSKAARYGMVMGILLLIMGAMLSCDCAGWFVFTAVIFLLPAFWGSRLLRFFSICLCGLSLFTAIVQFKHERALAAKLQKIRESQRQE